MLTLLKAGLAFLSGLMRYFGDKQLLDAGEARNAARASADQLERVRRANSVRIDGVPDPFDAANKRD